MLRPVHRYLPLVSASIVVLAGSAVFTQGGRGGHRPPGPQPTRAVDAPHFEYAGPVSAGRIAAAAAVAGKPGVYYAGAASGGVWKSSDGGPRGSRPSTRSRRRRSVRW